MSLGQPLLLPYKPSGSTKMYYVPQLRQIPSSLDSKSDTTIESSHSGIMQKLFKILLFEILFVYWQFNSGWHMKAQCYLIFKWNMEIFMTQSLVQIGELFGQMYCVHSNIW